MDDREATGAPDAPTEASEPPAFLSLALWVPVFAVVAWFMVRMFAGRWVTDPDPWRPDGDDEPRGPDTHET